jgi:hypothetical protein
MIRMSLLSTYLKVSFVLALVAGAGLRAYGEEVTAIDASIVVGRGYPIYGTILSDDLAGVESGADVAVGQRYTMDGVIDSRVLAVAEERAPLDTTAPASGTGSVDEAIALARIAVSRTDPDAGQLPALGSSHPALALLRRIRPSLGATIRSRSIRYEGESRDVMTLMVTPAATFGIGGSDWAFDGSYAYSRGESLGQSVAPVSEHNISANYRKSLWSHSSLTVKSSYATASDSEDRDVIDFTLARYGTSMLEVGFKRGVNGERLVLGTTVSTQHNDYDGEPDILRYGHDVTRLGGEILYRFRPRLTFSLGREIANFNYEDGSIDSNEAVWRVGTTYVPSQRLNVRAELSQSNKRFRDTGKRFNTPGWKVSLDFRPRRSSTVSLTTSQRFVETYTIKSHVELDQVTRSREIGVLWKQAWTSAFDMSIGFNHRDDAFDYSNVSTETMSLLSRYRMRKWLTLGVCRTLDMTFDRM